MMVPLSEVKGQMEDTTLSQHGAPQCSWRQTRQLKTNLLFQMKITEQW